MLYKLMLCLVRRQPHTKNPLTIQKAHERPVLWLNNMLATDTVLEFSLFPASNPTIGDGRLQRGVK